MTKISIQLFPFLKIFANGYLLNRLRNLLKLRGNTCLPMI